MNRYENFYNFFEFVFGFIDNLNQS